MSRARAPRMGRRAGLPEEDSMRIYALLAGLVMTMAGCPADSNNGTTDTLANDTSADVVDTAGDSSLPDTNDTSAPDTNDTSVPDTSDTSVPDTSDTTDSSVASDADTTTHTACSAAGECTWCTFPSAPKTVADCYCTICPTTPMTATECTANQEAWTSVCGGDKWYATAQCPVPRCVLMPELTCTDGACVDKCAGVECPALDCPADQQVKDAGECCAHCPTKRACDTGDDCAMCAFDKKVESAEDCYCVFCPSTPMSKAQCNANSASWQTFCNPWPLESMCPQPSCLPSSKPICDEAGQCQLDPNRCFFGEDCGHCTRTEVPKTAADCRCPGCPQPLATRLCEEIGTAYSEVCPDFDESACPVPPCVFPPPAICGPDQTCIGGPRDR